MNFGIKDKVALITAASTGLGFACAEALLQEGAKVAFCSRSADKVKRAVAQLKERGPAEAILGGVVDYTHAEQTDAFLRTVAEKLGSIDILVCSSGGPPPGKATDFTVTDYAKALENNLLALARVSLTVVPNMRVRKWGRIVFISSYVAEQPSPTLALSNVARIGLHGFAKSLALEVAADGVMVHCVMPGRINTARIIDLTRKAAETNGRSLNEQMAIEFARIPAGRYGQPKELANLVTFLCSECASYMTGTTVAVDGGLLISSETT